MYRYIFPQKFQDFSSGRKLPTYNGLIVKKHPRPAAYFRCSPLPPGEVEKCPDFRFRPSTCSDKELSQAWQSRDLQGVEPQANQTNAWRLAAELGTDGCFRGEKSNHGDRCFVPLRIGLWDPFFFMAELHGL